VDSQHCDRLTRSLDPYLVSTGHARVLWPLTVTPLDRVLFQRNHCIEVTEQNMPSCTWGPLQETYLAQTHFCKTETTRNHPHQNVLVTRTQVKTLYKQQTPHIKNNSQTNLDLRNTTLGDGFHFQHRNPRTLPVESFVHDSGRTLVRAEYGYPKGSPNTNS
jgi:hypothetical protein